MPNGSLPDCALSRAFHFHSSALLCSALLSSRPSLLSSCLVVAICFDCGRHDTIKDYELRLRLCALLNLGLGLGFGFGLEVIGRRCHWRCAALHCRSTNLEPKPRIESARSFMCSARLRSFSALCSLRSTSTPNRSPVEICLLLLSKRTTRARNRTLCCALLCLQFEGGSPESSRNLILPRPLSDSRYAPYAKQSKNNSIQFNL